MQISRLFNMLYILLSRDRVSAPQLARELEVSVRTVYRDAQTLCEAGVPLYAERGRDGGIAILPAYKLNKSVLSEPERQSILDSLSALSQSGAEDQAVLRKLSAFFGTPARDWVQIDFADWSGTQEETFSLLKQAILQESIIAFDYYGENSEMHSRKVCPLKLWFKGQAWYLCAYCLHRSAMRTFKLSRLKRVQILPGTFPNEALLASKTCIPADEQPESEYVRLVLHADACMAYRVYDDFEERGIKKQPDGSFRIDAQYPPGEWIVSSILGYGAHAEVLEPLWLRNEIRNTIKKMADRYNT